MPRSRLSLYQCGNAKVDWGGIHCAKGHKLASGNILDSGEYINIECLECGKPLEITECQKCLDLDYFGDSVIASERGWLNKEAI